MKFKRNLLACVAGLLCAHAQVQAQSLSEVVQSALQMYPSMLSAKSKTEAQRADISRARSAHYPQISYGVTRSKYANTDLPASMLPNMRSPQVKVNIWSGGRIEADARRSEALTTGAEWFEANTRDDVAQAAAEAYINWARAQDMHALAAKNLESHRITLEDIEKIVSVDTGRRIDLEQAQVRMDNARLFMLQRETDLNQARQRMTRFWQGPLPAKLEGAPLEFGPQGRLAQTPQTYEQVLDAVTDDLPSVAQQKAQVLAAQAAVDLARGQHWPSVDLTSSRQMNLVSTGLFGSTYQEDTLTQVTMSMPLYNGGAVSAQVDAALAQLKAAQHALDEARLLAKERATFAFQDWQNAQGRALQGQSQARVGSKVVDGYRQQFRLARRQLLDLLNIQAEAFNYQSAATTAYYDEQISKVRLLSALGDLAKRFDPS